MASYTTWQKVLDLYPRAADIESNATNQTNLITAKSNLFQSYIRNVHKADLASPYDEVVKECVANLVIDELRRRRITDDTELEAIDFEHIKGLMTHQGLSAHTTIDGIRRGAIVLSQDHAAKDVQAPEAVVVTQTGTGELRCVLPGVYRSWTQDTFRILITTAGRADAGTARFSVWRNFDAVAVSENNPVTADLFELTGEDETISPYTGMSNRYGGLFVQFRDLAVTGDSFEVNDEWTIKAVPADWENMTAGPHAVDFVSG